MGSNMITIYIMNYHKTIANNIKLLCKQKKLSYSELARKANIPLMTVQGLLYKTRKEPHLSTVHALAKALKVSVDQLLR